MPTLQADEDAFIRALSRVFSNWCPLEVLQFQATTDDSMLAYWGAHLAIEYTVTQHATKWPGDVHPEDFSFDVHLSSVDEKAIDGFTLHFPAAAEPPTKLRERSVIPTPASPLSAAEVVNDAQTARAFDRLYDEVWSLFFDGDPIVPLKEPAAVLTP